MSLASLREKLVEALGSGVLTAEDDGTRITYRSTEDLIRGIAALDRQIADKDGKRVRDVIIRSSKGFDQ
jgi:hypothetical protein